MLQQIRSAFKPIAQLPGPIQLILFITEHCNARCGHCFNWRAVDQGDDGLRLDELRTLSSGLGDLLTLSISGGEPTLRADLAEATGIFTGSNAVRDVSIPTNGLLPDLLCSHIRRLLAEPSRGTVSVSLSLDGLERRQDEMRGVHGSFRRIMETYQALVRLRDQTGSTRLLIKVGTVISSRNVREIPALIEWVRTEMPSLDFHNFEILRGDPRDKSYGAPSEADLEWLEPQIFAAWRHYGFYGRNRPIQSWVAAGLKRYTFRLYREILRRQRQLIPCYAGNTSLVVDAQGNASFCELRPAIGNLRSAPLAQLWHSREADSARLSIRRGECYCVHSCFQQKNVYLNRALWPHIALYILTGIFSLPPVTQTRADTDAHAESRASKERKPNDR